MDTVWARENMIRGKIIPQKRLGEFLWKASIQENISDDWGGPSWKSKPIKPLHVPQTWKRRRSQQAIN